MEHVLKRGKWYHFKRRIPVTYRHLYGQTEFVCVSLKTDSEALAKQRAHTLNIELEKLWVQSFQSDAPEIQSAMKKAVRKARLNGFSYLSARELVEEDIGEIINRLLVLKGQEHVPDHVEAVLGGLGKPDYPVSKAVQDFIEFEMPNIAEKSQDQIRKWKNPRIKAINNFISIAGDKDVTEISREDVLKFRAWWHKRIQSDGLTPNSSNKDFSYVRQVLAYVRDDKGKDVDVSKLFERIRFAEKKGSRPPFETAFIKDRLLDLKALSSLNNECRFFLFAMADTGARPGEIVGLDASNNEIRLDAPIPHIVIQPNSIRTLKTDQSERLIPLTGASLFAFQNLPQGFSHYLGKSDLLSSTLNKYLSERGLFPSEEHSVYSLRHSFEDRLTEVGTPEKVMASLMGHKYLRERYGSGPSLELKMKYLDRMCLFQSVI